MKDGDWADDRQPNAVGALPEREQLPDGPLAMESDAIDEGDGAQIEILKMFRRKMAGARRLPWRERVPARLAAFKWLKSALVALRDRRVHERRPPSARLKSALCVPKPS
jgi:hypothetical protein